MQITMYLCCIPRNILTEMLRER